MVAHMTEEKKRNVGGKVKCNEKKKEADLHEWLKASSGYSVLLSKKSKQ